MFFNFEYFVISNFSSSFVFVVLALWTRNVEEGKDDRDKVATLESILNMKTEIL